MSSSFQPFPIAEFKTGMYQYLQPWLRPIDAFNPLTNAYVYRGVLYKRSGIKPFGDLETVEEGGDPAPGRLKYKDYLAIGDGTPGPYSLSTDTALFASTLILTAGAQTVTDDGNGILTGDGSGTVNYETGAISVTFDNNVGTATVIYGEYSTDGDRPIMGIKSWINPLDDTTKLIVFDTRRASVYNEGTQRFEPINTVNEQIGFGTGGAGPYSVQAGFVNIVPGSFTLTDGTESFTSDTTTPVGNLTGSAGGSGTINWATGAISVTFNAGTSSNFTLAYTLQNNYFTGDFTKFFQATNWKPTTTSYLYIVNNTDRLTLYDGTNLSRPNLYISQAARTAQTNSITTAVDVDVYKNRLLLHRPTTTTSSPNPEGQTVRFSRQFDATEFRADVAGNGGALVFPTQDFLQSGEFLRDQLVIFFKNSTFLMKASGLALPPFIAQKINSTKSINSPYASVQYDERITSIGDKGHIACDGVNVQRYDLNIIDEFQDIEPNAIKLCFAQRFDTINQTWILYPSLNQTESDKVLVYNFLENTWAKYSIALSCLGLYKTIVDQTWEDFGDLTWEQVEDAWNSYVNEAGSPTLLGGGHDGTIYILNSGLDTDQFDRDTFTNYTAEIISTQLNPFAKKGSMVDLGYIDFYYNVDEDVELTLDFSFNSEEAFYSEQRTIVFTAQNGNQNANFQRVYLNASCQFFQFKITSSSEGNFKINGIIIWAKEGGRITPGATLI